MSCPCSADATFNYESIYGVSLKKSKFILSRACAPLLSSSSSGSSPDSDIFELNKLLVLLACYTYVFYRVIAAWFIEVIEATSFVLIITDFRASNFLIGLAGSCALFLLCFNFNSAYFLRACSSCYMS